MKKVALSLLALAIVGTSAFAADSAAGSTVPAPLTATLAANAWASAGIDLDTKSYGFKNGAEAKISLDILKGTNEKGQSVGGYIKIEDIKILLDGNTGGDPAIKYDATKAVGEQYSIDKKGLLGLTIGDVTAKLLFGDLYIKLYGNTNPALGYTADGDDDNGGATTVADDAFYTYSKTYGATDTEWQFGKLAELAGITSTGIEVGYSIPKVVDLSVGVATQGAWSSTDKDGQPAEAQFGASLTAVDKLTLGTKLYVGNGTAGAKDSELTKGLGAEVAYDLGVAVPFAHVNVVADTNTDLADGYWNADFGSKLPLVDGFKAVLVAGYDSSAKASAMLTTDLAANKLVGPLAIQAGVWLQDLTSDVKANKKTDVFAKVSADVADKVNVWGKTSYNLTGADDSSSIYLKAGVDYTALSLTTLSVEWDSSDFGAAKTTGDSKLGQLFLKAKVAY